MTTRRANDEFKTSGLLISVPSPDGWLDVLPTDKAVVPRPGAHTKDKDEQETLEVKVDVDKLVAMMEENFVQPYIGTIGI
jgi:hypothetical protein